MAGGAVKRPQACKNASPGAEGADVWPAKSAVGLVPPESGTHRGHRRSVIPAGTPESRPGTATARPAAIRSHPEVEAGRDSCAGTRWERLQPRRDLASRRALVAAEGAPTGEFDAKMRPLSPREAVRAAPGRDGLPQALLAGIALKARLVVEYVKAS